MTSKILTVTIPTWNRAGLLEELLIELIRQILSDKLESRVELLISNNGSDDDTEKIVLALKSKFDFISYNNNGINKGARYNVLKCMELASGEYLILFGDDDRPNIHALRDVIDVLERNKNIGALYDSHIFKRNSFGNTQISLEQLLDNFFYYLGNAGLFIISSGYIKAALKKHQYDFYSPTWPQTQLFILGSEDNQNDEIWIYDLNLLAKGKHEEVMIYTSYYLWRTTYIDLVIAIESIKNEINSKTYLAGKNYFRKNVTQLFFNILQCGVFLDDSGTRYKTANHIFKNLPKVSSKEKILLIIAATALVLPVFFTRTLSNVFIFFTRGNAGLRKKNEFIKMEMEKRRIKSKASTNTVREFDFKNV